MKAKWLRSALALAAITWLTLSCSKPHISTGGAPPGWRVEAGGAALGYVASWDKRKDLVVGEPLDLSTFKESLQRQESADGSLKRGNVDLGQSTIQYFTRKAGSEPAAATAVPEEKEPFEIVDHGPEGELPIEMRRPTIYVMFSLPVVPLAKLGEPITSVPFLTIDPPVEGVYRWYGTRALSFEPKETLVSQPRYTVTVSPDVASLGGKKLGKAFSFEFYTETVKVVNLFAGGDPDNNVGTNEVPTKAATKIVLEFNQPVEPEFIGEYLAVTVGAQPAAFTVGRPAYPDRLADRTPRGVLLTLSREPPEATDIRVTLRDGAAPKSGFPQRRGEQTQSLRTVSPFAFNELSSYSYDMPRGNTPSTVPVYAFFSHTLDATAARQRPTVTAGTYDASPLTPVSVEVFGSAMRINLQGIEPGATVNVSFSSSVKDLYGRALSNPGKEYSVAIPEPRPMASFPVYYFSHLEAAFPPKFVWEGRNLAKGEMGLAGKPDFNSSWQTSPEMTALDLSGWVKNRTKYNMVDLKPYLNSQGFGTVFAAYNLYDREAYRFSGRFAIQVTDLGITTRFAYNRILVWVNSLSTGQPVAQASVTVFNNKEVKKTTQTDVAGLAAFSLASGEFVTSFNPNSENDRNYLNISVQKGSDRAELAAQNTQNSWGSSVYAHSDPKDVEAVHPRIMIFTDRGLYKPGEELALRGIHWGQDAAGFIPYHGKYTLTLSDPSSGQTIWSVSANTSFSGGFAHRFKLPATLEPGDYQIRYQAGDNIQSGVSFTIAQFRRLSFQVSSVAPTRLFTQGDDVAVDVRASYLAGGAMTGGSYSYFWTRSATQFSPPGSQWQGYVFGPGNWEGDHTLSTGSGVLGAGGGVTLSEKSVGQNAAGAAYQYTVETTVVDIDRQAIASTARVLVHPASFYIGARFASGSSDGWWSRFVATGQNVKLDAQLVSPDGQAVSQAVDVTARLIHGTWKSTEQQGVYGRVNTRWEYVEEEIQSQQLQAKGGKVQWDFQVKDAGSYSLALEAKDAQARMAKTVLSFYATGSSYVRDATETPTTIDLVVDKSLYSPGETARILVQSPIPGGRYLLTVEREGILDEKVVELKGGQALLEVPVKAEYLPVFYVALSSFTKREKPPADYFDPDLGRPRGLFGITGVRVSTKPVELTVEVLPLKGAYKPGSDAQIAVRVTQNGAPVANAEVTLLAVDRGVLDLVNYHVPNPLDFFYAPWNFPLGVQGDDSRRLLIAPVTYDTTNLVGGDALKLQERKDFNPLALFEPLLATDKNGVASVRFKLPDTLTTYRLTAVAMRENRLGYQEKELLVQNPINVRTALPRRMRNRDTAAAGVVLQNLTLQPQKVQVTAESTILDIAGDRTKTVEIAPLGVYELPFILVASRPGEGTVTFTTKSDVLNEKLTETMIVERPLVKEAFTTVGTIGRNETQSQEGLVLPSRIAPGYGDLTVKASSTLRPYVEPALGRLLDWDPWWGSYWNLTYGFAAVYEKTGEAVVAGFLADLAGRQLSGGGIYTGSWRWTPFEPDPFVSLVTAHFMAFARDRGRAPTKAPDAARLLSYLQGLPEGGSSPYFRAYLSYVLSLYGRADDARLRRTEALEDKLGLGGYGLLAQAYLVAKDTRSAKRVYQRSKNFVMVGTQTVDLKQTYEVADFWSSMVGELALLLKNAYALGEDTELIQRIAGSLNRTDRNWQTRNDDLWTLLAFIPMLDAEGPERGEGSLELRLQDKPVGKLTLTAASPQEQAVLPFFDPPLKDAPRDQTLPLRFVKGGDTPLYYTAMLRYALPNETAFARDEGLGVYTQYELLDGTPVKEDSLTLGATYRVRVDVSSPKRRAHLELLVPIPSGAEIVDPSLATTGRFLPAGGTGSVQTTEETVYGETATVTAEGYGYGDDWYWYRPDYFALDNMMVYRWTDFYAGQKEVSFLIRVTTPGVFPTPPAGATLEFEPEVFGRADGRLFVVRP